jgi:hypothetical protein
MKLIFTRKKKKKKVCTTARNRHFGAVPIGTWRNLYRGFIGLIFSDNSLEYSLTLFLKHVRLHFVIQELLCWFDLIHFLNIQADQERESAMSQ